jgi:hypothetical protein
MCCRKYITNGMSVRGFFQKTNCTHLTKWEKVTMSYGYYKKKGHVSQKYTVSIVNGTSRKLCTYVRKCFYDSGHTRLTLDTFRIKEIIISGKSMYFISYRIYGTYNVSFYLTLSCLCPPVLLCSFSNFFSTYCSYDFLLMFFFITQYT